MKKFDQSEFNSALLKLFVVFLVPVVAGIGMFVKILWSDNADSSPLENGYVAPTNVYGVVKNTQRATVVVTCSDSKGSGFGFFFTKDDEARFADGENLDEEESDRTLTSQVVITSFHVIKNCLDSTGISVTSSKGKTQPATVLTVDEENDLAALLIPKRIPALTSIDYKIRTGYWAMAVGSPFDMSGTTTFGNIIYTEGPRIYTSASLNRGNSGGPLVDNVGLVYGVNTGFQAVAQNINWAVDINAVCQQIAICSGGRGLLHPVPKMP
jgi:S1-C subfamily serine protease